MKAKVKDIVVQATTNLVELTLFLVTCHQRLSDPQNKCELTEDIISKFDVWHDELLKQCFNSKRAVSR